MYFEGEETLGRIGVEVGPPNWEEPRLRSGFDEVLGEHCQGGRGIVGRLGGEEPVGGVGLGRGISKVTQGGTAVSRDPVQDHSDSPVPDLVEGSLDPPGFDPVGGCVERRRDRHQWRTDSLRDW